jgi:hypothetical protein
MLQHYRQLQTEETKLFIGNYMDAAMAMEDMEWSHGHGTTMDIAVTAAMTAAYP